MLYESDEPLLFGNWLYPFKIHLPSDIPGSFFASSDSPDVTWEASVNYRLDVSVIGASHSMSVDQSVNVQQSTRCKCPRNSSPEAVHWLQPIRSFIFTRAIHIVTRLHEHIHQAGSNVKLRVIITNKSSIQVQSLNLKLMRKIRLMSKKPKFREDPNVVYHDKQVDRLIFRVEDKLVVEEQTILMQNFQKGLDQIQIPLKNQYGIPICPSVRGMHIQCDYRVLLTVLLANGTTFEITVPVPVIVTQPNGQWTQWKAPPWLSSDGYQIQHSDSVFGVPENVLKSECFSNLPGFQPLG